MYIASCPVTGHVSIMVGLTAQPARLHMPVVCVQHRDELCIVWYNHSTHPWYTPMYTPMVHTHVHAHGTHPCTRPWYTPMVALLMYMCIVSILCDIMRVPVLVHYLIRTASASTIPPPYHMQCVALMAPCEVRSLPVLPRPLL